MAESFLLGVANEIKIHTRRMGSPGFSRKVQSNVEESIHGYMDTWKIAMGWDIAIEAKCIYLSLDSLACL